MEPTWYPEKNSNYDEIYQHKLKALKHILESEIDEQYQKVDIFLIEVYDSQD